MNQCPYCDFQAENASEEIAHMQANHPDVIIKRLEEAGEHQEAEKLRTGKKVEAYTEDEMNQAIQRVETAKQNHPHGWACLADLSLTPTDSFLVYAFTNAHAHSRRLGLEDDIELVYSAGWLNGLMIGVALAEQRR